MPEPVPISSSGPEPAAAPARRVRWLNRTVLGIGLASLCGDWGYEAASAVLPAFLAALGAGAAGWLGLVEGVADGLSALAKLGSGYYTDGLPRRKPVALAGYLLTPLATAGLALVSAPGQVVAARALAWLGRGVRGPVRKALLAGAVDRPAYGRAFGFERAMDTLGAVLGPLSALALLAGAHQSYRTVFALTLAPGLAAFALVAWAVREGARVRVGHVSFGRSWRALPGRYRRFLLAAGLFGAGSFAHTLLILLATQRLTPLLGAPAAGRVAVGLYVLHNVFSAGFSYLGGVLADRFPKRGLLGGGYALALVMVLTILFLPAGVGTMAVVFVLGGVQAGLEETLEDAFCAELVPPDQHGMAFGVLASVNGVGDLVSSVVVGALWSACGPAPAFAYSGLLFAAGACLVARVGGPAPTTGAGPATDP